MENRTCRILHYAWGRGRGSCGPTADGHFNYSGVQRHTRRLFHHPEHTDINRIKRTVETEFGCCEDLLWREEVRIHTIGEDQLVSLARDQVTGILVHTGRCNVRDVSSAHRATSKKLRPSEQREHVDEVRGVV
jgi:hypothetical protein